MRKERRATFLLVLVVVLLALTTVLGENIQVEASTATIYVPDDYPTIQAAVNAASSGDTIVVRDGNYIENVDVNKSLIIKSENRAEKTIVQAKNVNDHVFEITASQVKIRGFRIMNGKSGIYLSEVEQCDISNNVIWNNNFGIYLVQSSKNTIINNTVLSNSDGIWVYHSSDNNLLTGNMVSENSYGICVCYSSSNTLVGNAMWDNYWNLEISGDRLSHYTHAIDASNQVNGKPVCYWVGKQNKHVPSDVGFVGIINSTDIVVSDLSLTNNTGDVLVAYSRNCKIQNISISDSMSGIHLLDSLNISLIGNTLRDQYVLTTGIGGIHIDHSFDIILVDNNISSYLDGIIVYYSSNTTLTNNRISDNGRNLSIDGSEIPHFIHNIDDSNTVNGKPIQYIVNKQDLIIDSNWNAGYLGVANCRNVTIKNLTLTGNAQGVLLAYVRDSKIQNVTASNNFFNIDLIKSSRNIITNSTVSHGAYGIRLRDSSNNILFGNTISNNTIGVSLSGSDNLICLNNFEDSHWEHTSPWPKSTSKWDSPEAITYTYNNKNYTNYLGNYWSDYTGSDANGDGIGDVPYSIDEGKDNYPLIKPLENYIENYNILIPPTENSPPNTPTELAQFRSDGTLLGVGSTTYKKTVIFKGKIGDPDGDEVKLQVELRRLDEYDWKFNASAGDFKESEFVGSGGVATAYAYGLIEGDYHWRARAVDEHGLASGWLESGNNDISKADLTIGQRWAKPGTIIVPDNYSTIQAAINAATVGDTIIVCEGTYIENVRVNKSLTIMSEGGAESTIIQATNFSSSVFEVTNDHVTISGFTIKGAIGRTNEWNIKLEYKAGIFLNRVKNCNITGNNLLNNDFGIYLYYSNSNYIANNIANFNPSNAIRLRYSNNNKITNNILFDNNWGILLMDSSNGNIIKYNNLLENWYGIDVGSTNNKIYFNNFTYNFISCFRLSPGNKIYLNNFKFKQNMDIRWYQAINTWNSPNEINYSYNGKSYIKYLGNYWDNYSGSDADGDGVGDIPYNIGSDKDNYPLMKPVENYEIGFGKTIITITPSNFTLIRGSITLTAILKELISDDPLPDKTIICSINGDNGVLNLISGITNSSGQVSTTYTARAVLFPTLVNITASFAGDALYSESNTIFSGKVLLYIPPVMPLLVLGSLLIFTKIGAYLPYSRRILGHANFRRALMSIIIFGLSFFLFLYGGSGPTEAPTTWFWSGLISIIGTTLLLSALEQSSKVGFVFGVSFWAGFFGLLLPRPEVGIGGILLVVLMLGSIFGGFCVGFARLGLWITGMRRPIYIPTTPPTSVTITQIPISKPSVSTPTIQTSTFQVPTIQWPTGIEYQEAFQNPHSFVFDPELKSGIVERDPLGMPKGISGRFGCVFKIQCGSKVYAAKCYTLQTVNLQERYNLVSHYFNKVNLPFLIKFIYFPEGVLIRGKKYSILKMEWAEGENLDKFIENNLYNKDLLKRVAEDFIDAVIDLQDNVIVHGDLQHGNIIVKVNHKDGLVRKRDEAFHFFTNFDVYTGYYASNLKEFCDIIQTINIRSIAFHVSGGDFKNWIRTVLKDDQLALRIDEINRANLSGEELRKRLYETVIARYNQLLIIKLYFVDYDCMYIPGFFGKEAPELGHVNYQHPKRAKRHYGERLDNFSSLVIYLNLLAITEDPRLWKRYYNGENMILTEEDFKDPLKSKAIQELLESRSEKVRKLTKLLLEALKDDPLSDKLQASYFKTI